MREIGKGGVQDRCVKYARNRGWYARKFKSPANNAVPDFLFAKRRLHLAGVVREVKRTIFVEFKATGKKPTPLQLEEHAEMRAAGLAVSVIDSVEAFASLLSYLEP